MRTLLSHSETSFRVLVADGPPSSSGTVALVPVLLGHEAIPRCPPRKTLPLVEKEAVDILPTDHGMTSMTVPGLSSPLRNQDSLIPIILMSERDAEIDLRSLHSPGAFMILERPFKSSVVRKALENAMA